MGKGFLAINLYIGEHVLPVENAAVLIKDKEGNIIYDLVSDRYGRVEKVSLDAPNVSPSDIVPGFALYDVEVPYHNGFKKVVIHDVEIFDQETTILPIQLHPAVRSNTLEQNTDEYFIPTQRSVAECERRALRETPYRPGFTDFTERILANEVAIPNYITVHLGVPNDSSAKNETVPFKDYIKNVASREVFPTWTKSALTANILAQMSFALNRLYTVWYRSQFKDFDITNNTAWDQAYDSSRVTFESISNIVDEIFSQFIRRPGRREPFISQFCNGTTATCDGLLQCESQELGLNGYTAMQILKRYYPNDIQIVESENFSTPAGRYPGALRLGDTGEAVLRMQLFLNRLSGNWWLTPIQNPNGSFGSDTQNTVKEFQSRVPNPPLSSDGIIGMNTWYAITQTYNAAKRLAELDSEGERISIGAAPPTVTLYPSTDPVTRGEYVVELQFLLNFIAQFYPTISSVIQNGVFREDTKRGVIEFQKEFGLTGDGIVGPRTWQKLYEVYQDIQGAVEIPSTPPIEPETPPDSSVPQFPGTSLRIGSSGTSVLLMQNYLNAIAQVYTTLPILAPDGAFGAATQTAVMEFQRLFGLTVDGVIGPTTWYKIIDVYNNLTVSDTPQFPGTVLRIGSRGNDVLLMQEYLRAISAVFPVIPSLTADGVFGAGTQASVIAFQTLFGLTPDGAIGSNTWDKIIYVYNSMPVVAAPQYPGTALRMNSRGNDVIIMQKYLNLIATQYPSIPTLAADGIFGAGTQAAVIAFQRQFGLGDDGVIGRITWNHIVSVYNLVLMNTTRRETSITSAISAHAKANTKTNTKGNPLDQYALLLAFSMLRR